MEFTHEQISEIISEITKIVSPKVCKFLLFSCLQNYK